MSSLLNGDVPGVTNVAVATRFGVKGADAATWLQQHGVAVPPLPNRFVHWHTAHGSGRCVRQGNSEFLVEFDSPQPLRDAAVALDRAWVLARADHSLVLQGPHWPALLAHVCSFDFARLDAEADLVVMTLLAGISVTLVREPSATGIALRLWCDPGFASYLHHCLHSISQYAAPATRGSA